jgi:F0F1-type ATP synthase assembly protein I
LSGGEFAGLGVQFAGAILLFLWLGQWVDAKLGTSPAGVLVGVFTGAGGAFYAMYRKLTAAERADEARKRP